ncbi:MAG: endonuclease III [candidate division KSB1 bacterium]|nr:endonuclease III [candidate division KSB1 bacterium]
MWGATTTVKTHAATAGEHREALRKRTRTILRVLRTAYPDARLELEYSNPLELLIATILAAQCTDERVNQVTRSLFQKYKQAEDYLKVPVTELEEDIRPTGFFHNKAKSIQSCCNMLVRDFQGQVPQTVEELTRLPGVGRKTANIVLGNAFGQQAIAVDTHVKRVALRLGLAHQEDPDKIEQELCQAIPRDKWTQATHVLVFHGRKTCQAKNPRCSTCVVYGLCEWEGKK